MNFIYRKTRSVLYLIINLIVLLFLFPFNKKANIQLHNNLKRDEIINFILEKKYKKKAKYLEIGCDLNQTFSKVDNEFNTGVDPVRGGNVKLTSKEFFENYNKETFDFIFIDGSHLIEDVFFDTVQSLNNLNVGGYILLDDVLPNNLFNTFRRRITLHSFQDAYKILFFLRELKFIKVYLIPSDHGMALVKLTDNLNINEINYNFDHIDFESYMELLKNKDFQELNNVNDLLDIL